MRLQRLGPNQKFEVKTSTAVIGAVGTDFFVEATPQFTRVIVFEGAVIVSGFGAAIAASQTVLAGNQSTVFPEQPPSSPQPASQADIQQSQQETDVGEPLPSPPAPPRARPPLLKNKWFWIAAGAATAVTVGIIVGTRGPRTVTGCPVPSASSSSSSSSVSVAAVSCPP
ncbi:MAG: FecR domain-containing protein [Candidatus Acidiferrales bacterium]